MANIQEYYLQIEKENIDSRSLCSSVETIINTPYATDIFYLLIEKDVLNNVYYTENKFAFWRELKRYNFDKLSFKNFDELNNAAISYIESRSDSSSNKLFKAKYSHILWYSSVNNKFKYARISIDNYYEYVSEWLLKYDISGKEFELDVLENLGFLNKLCNSVKYRFSDFLSLLKELITKKDLLPEWFIFNVIEIVFLNRNSFDSDYNKKCFQTLEDILNSSDLGSLKEDVYSLGIKYGQFLKVSLLNLHNLMGNFCLQFAIKRDKGKSDFLIPEYYGRAITYFKLANNKEMEDKLNADFNKIKSANELPTVTFEMPFDKDLSAIIFTNEQIKQNHIEGLTAIEMIDFICNDENLIPSNINPISQNHLFDIFKKSNFDINNNFNHVQSKPIINPFNLHLEIFTVKYLHYCFKNCIELDKINSDKIISHLENNSWLGNTKEGSYWLDLLRPGIASFFSVYKKYLSAPTLSNLEIVLPLDSLATKMEGILRTFAQLNGINTTKIENEKIKGSSDIQTREVFIHELLSESYPEFKAFFSDNEYKFFKTIYLKDGYDIRNNIAHSFYKLKDYTIDKLLLIILSIMRISKYNVLSK